MLRGWFAFLTCCLAWEGLWAAPALGSKDPDFWLDAPGYEATITDAGEGSGLVFTSVDYQKLLLFPDTGEYAYVFDLKSHELAEVPRSAVRLEEEGARLSHGTEGSPRGVFTVERADIHYEAEALKIHLGPKPDLVGEVSLEEILARKPGYKTMAAAYKPAASALDILHKLSTPVDILVFFGTWCPVCSRRLPLFLKTIRGAENPNLRVRFIAIAEDYQQPLELIKANKVTITPTFIVKLDGTEIGRVEKTPKVSLEEDLAAIIKKME